MTKQHESKEARERGRKKVRRAAKADVPHGTSQGWVSEVTTSQAQDGFTANGRDRDAQGAVPDGAKRNPEQPGPAQRGSPTERLRYRSLVSELRPWLKTLESLQSPAHPPSIQSTATLADITLTKLLIVLAQAGRPRL